MSKHSNPQKASLIHEAGAQPRPSGRVEVREEEHQLFRHWDHPRIILAPNPTMNPTVAELSLTVSALRSSLKSSTLSISNLSIEEEERGKKKKEKKRKGEELKCVPAVLQMRVIYTI